MRQQEEGGQESSLLGLIKELEARSLWFETGSPKFELGFER